MLDSNLVKDWRKMKWWGSLVYPHFEIENENNMASSSPQVETIKYLKYKLKEPVIRFTYHSSHVSFGLRRIRPVVLFRALQKWINACFASSLLQGNRHLCRWHVCTKTALSTVKLLWEIWNGQFSLHFELPFTVICFTWLTEDPLKNDSLWKVRLSNSATPKNRVFKQKCKNKNNSRYFSRMRRQKSPLLLGVGRVFATSWARSSSIMVNLLRGCFVGFAYSKRCEA